MSKSLPLLMAFALLGCVEIETKVKLQPDGSAIITERVAFSQQLLDLDGEPAEGTRRIADILTQAAVLERLKVMGKEIRLVSHTVEEGERGSRQMKNVFEISDIREFRYASPFMAYADFPANSIVRLDMEPVYEGTWWGREAGDLAVAFRPLERPKPQPQPREGEPQPKPPAPRDLQVFRELQPVFRDIVGDFRLKLTFESYGPLRSSGFGHRGKRAGALHADLIDFSSDNLDNYGRMFLENEEIMLDLLRRDIGSKNAVEHTKGYVNNLTLPVFLAAGSPHADGFRDEIYARPSPQLYEKHFAGKNLTHYFEKGPNRTRPATFKEIGQTPSK